MIVADPSIYSVKERTGFILIRLVRRGDPSREITIQLIASSSTSANGLFYSKECIIIIV